MTAIIQELLKQLKDKSYRALRTKDVEIPILYPVDYFGFHFGKNAEQLYRSGGNISPNFERIMTRGLNAIADEIRSTMASTNDDAKLAFGQSLLDEIDEIITLSKALRKDALAMGHTRLYEALETVPQKPAKSFYEACLFIAISMYFLRRSGGKHLGLGRFDQYMYPFYLRDKQNGVSEEELFECLEAFFITLNYDCDLYQGVQQGDNGQSMVLGGFDLDGTNRYNELSELCLNASLELSLIDPKINLRVGKNTPDRLYELGTKLTKQGLGFPQYCNDDVVIPGLIKLGYEPKDAENYVVAACWEYIIPNKGADIPNIETMNFPLVVGRAVTDHLAHCPDFDTLMNVVCKEISKECDSLIANTMLKPRENHPLLSLYIDGCIESLTDIWQGGARYHNFGAHGAGIANAADALAAIKKTVYDEKSVSKEELLRALSENFEGHSELRNRLKECPKMGNNDDYVDDIAIEIMSCFSKSMNNRPNGRGGIWRAGTGSAMEYLFSAEKCPATADGRQAGEPYSSSFSPSLDVKTTGLLSLIQSFTKYDMTEIINGGPLTIEIHDTVLRNDVGIQKTAMLVKSFILLGGHQLQLNSINRERLLDAQKNPERYPNLIVRVWGWSGYFNELDLKFQNHIIRRTEFFA